MATIEEALAELHGDHEIFRPLLEPEAIIRRICRVAETRATQKGREPWSVISDITGHGSGISNAIYQIYQPES